MKIKDIEKLKNARRIINLLQEGINPVSFEDIGDDSFLNDPKMIRMFSYLALVLSQDIREAEEEAQNTQNPKGKYNLTKHIIPEESVISDNYKSINDKIKSSKIRVFNKVAANAELTKLAQLIDKD